MDKTRILFIHKNFPAQFGAIGSWLSDRGWDVTFATERKGVENVPIRIVNFESHREPTKGVHQYVAGIEQQVIAGQGMARAAIAMQANGYVPDIVVAHSGWGVGTFVKDVWPDTKYVPYLEWFYAHPAVDRTPHDPLPGDPIDQSARTRVRNTPFWLDMSGAEIGLCPTRFQAAQFPEALRKRIKVMHDGVDTELHSPGPRNEKLMEELDIPMDAEIMSWVTRGMEPARGFPEMMAALASLQKERPNLHAIIVGEDRVAYGSKSAGSWKERMLEAHDFDQSRLHFTGLVSRRRMVDIIRAGDIHLYLTAPFVLSWSLLDAMSCGATIVGADVDPVREFVTHEKTGFLVDMYDPDALISGIKTGLDSKGRLGAAARDVILSGYSAQDQIYPMKEAFFRQVIEGRI